MALVVVSFDGVSDRVFEAMAADPVSYPNIAKFKAEAHYRGGMRTVFVSNTYPIHASIATGKLPCVHGVVSNHVVENGRTRWAQLADYIQAETIWDAAYRRGLTVASVLWPITCGAKQIRWNLPEVHLHGFENQLVENLRHGSPGFQLRALLRHGGKLLSGIPQPGIDTFSTAATCDLLRRHRPDLTLLHLIAYDAISHRVGSQSEKLDRARRALDKNLGKLLVAAGDAAVLVFSDHAHLDVREAVNLAPLYGDALLEQCSGSAFFRQAIPDLHRRPWFGRFLTAQELETSGFAARGAIFGIAAKPGYTFRSKRPRSDHGYPANYENYQVFYALRNEHAPPEPVFGDVRDITAIICRELGITL